MKQLSSTALPPKLTTVLSINSLLQGTILERELILSRMSGYPVPAHIAGRVFARIDLSSVAALKESLLTLRNHFLLASDILATIPLAKIDRYQLVRTELVAYVTAAAAQFGKGSLTPDEADFITHLITSSESSLSSWYLDFPANRKTNRITKFFDLYKSISAVTGTVSLGKNGKTVSLVSTGGALPFVYDPQSDSIVDWNKSNRAMSWHKRIAADSDPEEKAMHISAYESSLAYEKFCDIRLVDHTFQMLNNPALWDTFITMRDRVDAAQNNERARGLKLFSSYIHSLLLYPEFFHIAMFKATYDKLEKWFVQFPTLEAAIVADYETVVKGNDILNVHKDVADIYDKIHHSVEEETGVEIMGFFSEAVSIFNFNAALANAKKAAGSTSLPLTITNLVELGDPQYNVLLFNQPIAKVDLINDVTRSLLIQNATQAFLRHAVSSVLPYVQRYFAGDIPTRLAGLSLDPGMGWGAHIPVTTSPKNAVDRRITKNTVTVRGLAPWSNYDLGFLYRTKFLYKIDRSSSLVAQASASVPNFRIDEYKANIIQSQLKMPWQSLYPSWMIPGSAIFNSDTFNSDRMNIGPVLEAISGQNWEYIVRTIHTPYVREMWATYLSSWALLYTTSGEGATLTRSLVPGKGRPYGDTYASLEARQTSINNYIDIIAIDSNGVPQIRASIRLLDTIPMPSDTLSIADDMYMNIPYYYYPSNTRTAPVRSELYKEINLNAKPKRKKEAEGTSLTHASQRGKLVLAPPLMQFAINPASDVTSMPESSTIEAGGDMIDGRPAIFLDRVYAYLNDRLYFNVDMTSQPGLVTEAKYQLPINVSIHDWKFDTQNPFVTHNTVGSYGGSMAATSASSGPESAIAALNKQWEKEVIEANDQSTVSAEKLQGQGASHEKDIANEATAAAKNPAGPDSSGKTSNAGKKHDNKNKFKNKGSKPADLSKDKPNSTSSSKEDDEEVMGA